jgi:hypothetical protein
LPRLFVNKVDRQCTPISPATMIFLLPPSLALSASLSPSIPATRFSRGQCVPCVPRTARIFAHSLWVA